MPASRRNPLKKNKAMKTKTSPVQPEPVNEDDIRDYAHHLYLQSGYIPDRDLDNWLEAKACLGACIPQSESHTRLHRHSQTKQPQAAPETKVLAA